MLCYLCNVEMKKVLTDELRSGEKKKVFYCRNCDLGQLDNYSTEEDLKEYYRDNYRKIHKPDLEQENDAKELFNSYVNFRLFPTFPSLKLRSEPLCNS